MTVFFKVLFQEKQPKLHMLFVISCHRIFALIRVSLFERDSFPFNVNMKYLLWGQKHA